jgi:predicted ATPase
LLEIDSANAAKSEACFQQAVKVALSQKAKCWELRAATSLAQLWHSQKKTDEARDLLAPVYNWFTEGHCQTKILAIFTIV